MAVLVATLVAAEFVRGADQMADASGRIVKSLYEADNTMRRMENTLVTSSGTMSQAKNDLGRLREITDSLGVSLSAAAVPFAKFASSAGSLTKDLKFEVFEGFATALAGIHAEGRTVSGTFLALQQIMSKGKITMQDLRRQLSEHIPGAMQMAVKAYGDGTASQEEFNSAVLAGKIDTNEWIVSFARLMKEKFEPAAAAASQTLKASLERMDTAMLVSKKNIGNYDGAIQSWKIAVDDFTESILKNEGIQKNFAVALGGISRAFENAAENATPLIEKAAELSAVLGKGFEFGGAQAGLLFDSIALGSNTIIAHTASWVGLSDISKEYFEYTNNNMTEVQKNWEIVTGEADKYRQKLLELKNDPVHLFAAIDKKSMDDYFDFIDKGLAKEQEAKDTRIKLVEETFKATGQLSVEYFNNEKRKLVEQANKWHESGLSVNQANQWFFNEVIKLNERIKESTDKVANGYKGITASINEAMQKTREWNAMAYKEEAESGVGVSIGQDQARWQNGTWVTQGGQDIRTGPDEGVSEAATIINNFNQRVSPSDVSNIANMQLLQESRI